MIRNLRHKTIVLTALTVMLGLSSGTHAAAVYGTPPQTCFGGPNDNQAFVFDGRNFTGKCYVLELNPASEMDSALGDQWTSWDATTGFPNDAIQSVWVGNSVTLVLFWNDFNTSDNGAPASFGSNGWYNGTFADLNNIGWGRKASAARLQTFPFGQCDNGLDSENKFILFTNSNFATNNDCTILNVRGYFDPVDLGFRNDTASSIINSSDTPFTFVQNSSWTHLYFNAFYTVQPHTNVYNLGSWNDQLTRIGI